MDKRPLKVFLCHAHADRDPVRALYSRLKRESVDVWLDKEKLLPGSDWEYEIRKAVREADVVVVCLSKQFNQAGFRQKEVRLALDTAMEKLEGEIFIIPARLEECDNLESLRKWHWVDLFEDDGNEMLMRALRARAYNIGTTLQIKKPESFLLFSKEQGRKTKVGEIPDASHLQGKPIKNQRSRIAFMLIGLVVIILGVFWGIPSIKKPLFSSFQPTPSATRSPTPSKTHTPTVGPSPTATAIGGGLGKIIFESTRDGDSDIYIMNVDGSGAKNLTNNSDDDYIISLSPQGENILYLSDIGRDKSINILNITNGDSANLTENVVNFNFLGWSKNGDKFLYSSGYSDDSYWQKKKREIYCVLVDDSKIINLTNNNYDDWFGAWLPDESGIVFSSNRDVQWDIYSVKLDGSGLTNLTNYGGYDEFQGYSVDNKRIIFQTTRLERESDIYSMGLDGSDPKPFLIGKEESRFMSFSSDGTKLVFEGRRREYYWSDDIYIVNIDGSNLINLSQSSYQDHFYSWMPDDDQILFSSNREGNLDYFVIKTDGTGMVNLTKSSYNDTFISWSPDIEKMLFKYMGRSNDIVYLIDSDGSKINLFEDVSSTSDRLRTAFWSPDGSKLMVIFGYPEFPYNFNSYNYYYHSLDSVFLIDINDLSRVSLEDIKNPYWLP